MKRLRKTAPSERCPDATFSPNRFLPHYMKPRPQPEPPSSDWRDEVWRGRANTNPEIRSDTCSDGTRSSVEPSRVSKRNAVSSADQAELDSELALEHLLSTLPRPTASNNLAARVLAEVARESVSNKSDQGRRWWGAVPTLWARFGLRSFAWGSGLAVVLAAIVLQETVHERRAMAREVAELGAVTAIPGVEVLQNFDAISALGAGVRVHPTDIDLMAAMVAMGN